MPGKSTEVATVEPISQVTPSRLIQDAKDVAKWAAILYACFSIFLLGAQAACVKLLTKPGELTDDAIGFYLNVFTHTAPFTVGMTLVGILWSWYLRTPGSDGSSGFFGMTLLTALVLVVSSAIGNQVGVGAKIPEAQLVGNWPMGIGAIINSLYSYYLAYEGTLFFSALAVSALLVGVWIVKVEPLIVKWQSASRAP